MQITHDSTPPDQAKLTSQLSQHGFIIRTSSLQSATPLPNEPIIVLAELHAPIFNNMTKATMESLQRLTDGMASLIWVTGGALLQGRHPKYAMASGWARVLRTENHLLDLVLVDTDRTLASQSSLETVIVDTLKRWSERQDKTADKAQVETEYCIDNGVVHISRIVPDFGVNDRFASDAQASRLVAMRDAPPLTAVSRAGNITFHEDTALVDSTPLAPSDVEIAVRAIGLNSQDADVTSGTDTSPYFSHEISGIITATGSAVPTSYAVGTTVFGFSFSTMATTQRTRFELVQELKKDEDCMHMAGLPLAACTALYALEDLARMEKDEKVVIIDGCAGAGLVALQLCKAAGAVPIVVTDSERTIDFLRSSLGDLPAIVRPDVEDVYQALNRLTDGGGIDIIFCAGSAPSWQLEGCCKAMTPFGRLVMCGKQDKSIFSSAASTRNISVLNFDIRHLYFHKLHVLARYTLVVRVFKQTFLITCRLLQKAISLHRQGSIRLPSTYTQTAPSKITEALRSLPTQLGAPRSIVTFNPSATIPCINEHRKLHFSPTATYLLVGCLGGLGRSLSTWMIARGAKRLAFLSRSGADHHAAAQLVATIREKGAHVDVLKADVTCKEEVEAAINTIDPQHPIRGVVNAAVVMRVSLHGNTV